MRISLVGDLWALPNVDIEVKDLLEDSSLVLGNLETPIIEVGAPESSKVGPYVHGDKGSMAIIKDQVPDLCVSLANNHIMDFGESGLLHTLKVLNDLQVPYCGAGNRTDSAISPLTLSVDSVKVAILSLGEIQFGKAQARKSGYNPISPAVYQQIIDLKQRSDMVILSIHGASEMSPVPSPEWQELMRSYIDCGADIIHGHHSHVPQGYEKYRHGYIFYGLGNFIANPGMWQANQNTSWSIVPLINLNKSILDVDIITSVIEYVHGKTIIRRANGTEKAIHDAYLESCNRVIQNKPLLHGVWQEVSLQLFNNHYSEYLNFSGKFTIRDLSIEKRFSVLKRSLRSFITGKEVILPNPVSTHQHLLWYHLFACESHKHAIETALGVLSGELDDLTNEESKEILHSLTMS